MVIFTHIAFRCHSYRLYSITIDKNGTNEFLCSLLACFWFKVLAPNPEYQNLNLQYCQKTEETAEYDLNTKFQLQPVYNHFSNLPEIVSEIILLQNKVFKNTCLVSERIWLTNFWVWDRVHQSSTQSHKIVIIKGQLLL